MPATVHKPQSGSPSSEYERVTGNARILWLLNQLLTKRSLLTINLEGEAEQFTSAILEVDERGNQVILDGLMPDSGNQLLAKESEFRVSGSIDGIRIKFQATLSELQQHNGTVSVAAHIPKLINYRQRRDSHRIQSPMHYTLKVMLAIGNNRVEEGILRDLSHGGAQVLLQPGTTDIPKSTLLECSIQLPTDETLYCSAMVCYAFSPGNNSSARTGLRFLELTPYQQRAIERSTAFLEQQLAKKLAK